MISCILIVSAVFALVAAGHVAAVHAHAPSGAYRAPRALVTSASTLTDCVQPADACRVARAAYPMFTVSEQTIVGVARHSAPKVWTCGRVEANGVGGSQRTCEWIGR